MFRAQNTTICIGNNYCYNVLFNSQIPPLAVYYIPILTTLNNEQKQLHSILLKYFKIPTFSLWKSVNQIDIDHPFFFFHQRKAGGSSIRESLYDVSQHVLQTAAFIPCYTADCDLYNVPSKTRYSIYTGHLRYGAQHDLLRFNRNISTQYSCATNIRHPLHRIISCFHFRFPILLQRKCLNDLPIDELTDLMYRTDDYATSCLNEPFRAMSGVYDEDVLDHLMDSRDSPTTSASRKQLRRASANHHENSRTLRMHDSNLAISIFNLTMQHMQQCSPIILELPLSYELLNLRIPVLGKHGTFLSAMQTQQGKNKSCPPVSGRHLEVIQEQIALEMMLYDAVYKKTLAAIQTQFPDYLFYSKCKANNLTAKNFLDEAEFKTTNHNDVPVGLVAEYGMNIVAIRSIFEESTSLFTGSLLARKESGTAFVGEEYCTTSCGALYADPDHIAIIKNARPPSKNPLASVESSTKSSRRTAEQLPAVAAMTIYNSKSMKKCRRGGIYRLERIATFINDPFYVFYRKYQSLAALGKTDHDITLRDDPNFLSVLSSNAAHLRGNNNAQQRRAQSTVAAMDPTLSDGHWINQIIRNIQHEVSPSSRKLDTLPLNVDYITLPIFHENVMSLFVDFDTNYAMFQSYFNIISAYKASIHTWDDLEALMKNTTITSTIVQQYPAEDLMFYSYQAVYEGVRAISEYGKAHSDYNRSDASFQDFSFSSLYPDSQFNIHNNALLHLVTYAGYAHKMDKAHNQCLLANAPVSLMVLDNIHQMKVFYEQDHPHVFRHVKAYLKKWMTILQFDSKQVHFLYHV